MNMQEYLSLIGKKLEEAQSRNDKEEWVRLAEVLIDTLRENIEEIRK